MKFRRQKFLKLQRKIQTYVKKLKTDDYITRYSL